MNTTPRSIIYNNVVRNDQIEVFISTKKEIYTGQFFVVFEFRHHFSENCTTRFWKK